MPSFATQKLLEGLKQKHSIAGALDSITDNKALQEIAPEHHQVGMAKSHKLLRQRGVSTPTNVYVSITVKEYKPPVCV